MNKTITRITAGAGIALAGLLIPALGASASTQNAPVQHYAWATGFHSGTSAPASVAVGGSAGDPLAIGMSVASRSWSTVSAAEATRR